MRVLVTGGRGFIGGHVCDYLEAIGHEPLIFDRRKTELEYDQFLGDLVNDVDVTEAMGHVDGFIHLAGVLGTQETIKNPHPAAIVNVLGGLNVLEAAAQYDVPGVYIGVGNHWMNNTYSITKTTVERFVHMFNKEHGTRINIVRAMNAYGPRQVPARPYGPSAVRKITPSFICRALKNDPVELYGGGYQTSDMVYVTDVAKALVVALELADGGTVYNQAIEVGPAVHNTVREVAEMVIDITGSKSDLVDLPMRPGEIPNAEVTANTETLKLVGMSAENLVPLLLGLETTINWYRENWL